MKKIIASILILTITLTNSLTLSCAAKTNSARETYNSIVQKKPAPKSKKSNLFSKVKAALLIASSAIVVALLAGKSSSKDVKNQDPKEDPVIPDITYNDSPKNDPPPPSLNMANTKKSTNENLNEQTKLNSDKSVKEDLSQLTPDEKSPELPPPTEEIDLKVNDQETQTKQPLNSANALAYQSIDTNSNKKAPVTVAVNSDKGTSAGEENKNHLISRVLLGTSNQNDICTRDFFKKNDYFTPVVPMNNTFTNSSNEQPSKADEIVFNNSFDPTPYQEPVKSNFWGNVLSCGGFTLVVGAIIYILVKIANKLCSPTHVDVQAQTENNPAKFETVNADCFESLVKSSAPKYKDVESQTENDLADMATETVTELKEIGINTDELALTKFKNLNLDLEFINKLNQVQKSKIAKAMAEPAKQLTDTATQAAEAATQLEISNAQNAIGIPAEREFPLNEGEKIAQNLNNLAKQLESGAVILTPSPTKQKQVSSSSNVLSSTPKVPSTFTTPKKPATLTGANAWQTPTKLGSPSSPRRFSFSEENLLSAANEIFNNENDKIDLGALSPSKVAPRLQKALKNKAESELMKNVANALTGSEPMSPNSLKKSFSQTGFNYLTDENANPNVQGEIPTSVGASLLKRLKKPSN